MGKYPVRILWQWSKLPKAEFFVRNKGDKEGKASLAEYLGVRAEPWYSSSEVQEYNIIPFLAYYDVFKNYYANKQEERFYVMGGSSIQNAATVVSEDFTGKIADDATNKTLICETESTVTITGINLNLEDIKKILFTIDTDSIYIDVKFDNGGKNFWQKVKVEKDKIVLKTIKGGYYQLSRNIAGTAGSDVTLKGATEDIVQGTVTNA